MLLLLTKTDGHLGRDDRPMYVNYHSISYFTPYMANDDSMGSELFFHNGSIVHVRESPQEIYKMRHPWKEKTDAVAK